MNRDLPRMSLSSAKVIKIICYDLPYVTACWGSLCSAHPNDVKMCSEFLYNFCVHSMLTLKIGKFKSYCQPKSKSSLCGDNV